MGFVAFRMGAYFDQLMNNASRMHSEMLKTNRRTGDDDVITEIYTSQIFPKEIQLLPQMTFPVGNLLNLFSKRDEFPGLKPFAPYIFHANFVVGIRRKLLITKIAFNLNGIDLNSISRRRRFLMDMETLAHRLVYSARNFLKSRVR
jgi:hypothetical protein